MLSVMSLSFTWITGAFVQKFLLYYCIPLFSKVIFFFSFFFWWCILLVIASWGKAVWGQVKDSALAPYFLRLFIGDQLSHYLNVDFIVNIDIGSALCQKKKKRFPDKNKSELFQEKSAFSPVRNYLFHSFNLYSSSARMVMDQALLGCMRGW